MKARCHNPQHHAYRNYGGRGITVCTEWRMDFLCFLRDMGPRPPGRGATVDRIDNAGNYEPGNCRWATWRQQMNNKRINALMTYRGETHTTAEWARLTGLNYTTVFARRGRGWAVEDILKMPLIKGKGRAWHHNSAPSQKTT